jgi:hypothetical protein
MTGRNAFISSGLTGGMAEEKSQKWYDRNAAHSRVFSWTMKVQT